MSVEMIPVDREGKFKAQITEYGLREEESGTVNLAIKATLLAIWDGKEWVDWEQYNMQAQGFLCLVKKDGTLNKNQVVPLCSYAGWDGDFIPLANQEWHPSPCQVDIQNDTYKNKTTLRINWIADYNRVPGQMSNLNEDKARELQLKFGGQLRAMVGNKIRNAAKPNGATPPSPPPPPSAPPAYQHAAPSYPPRNDDNGDIPFSLAWIAVIIPMLSQFIV